MCLLVTHSGYLRGPVKKKVDDDGDITERGGDGLSDPLLSDDGCGDDTKT